MVATHQDIAPLSNDSFYNLTDVHFKKFFGISLEEAGFTELRLLHDFSDLSPRDAALEVGYAYDLDRIDLGWR